MVDIVVSHGFFVDETAGVLKKRGMGYCDYCAITSYKVELDDKGDAKVKILTVADDSHVKTKC